MPHSVPQVFDPVVKVSELLVQHRLVHFCRAMQLMILEEDGRRRLDESWVLLLVGGMLAAEPVANLGSGTSLSSRLSNLIVDELYQLFLLLHANGKTRGSPLVW